MPSTPGTVEAIGKYRVIVPVSEGRGLGGQVYLADDPDEAIGERVFLIKLLDVRGLERAKALRELRQARGLEHDAVASLVEYFEHGRQLAVVFESLEGLWLDELMDTLEQRDERLSLSCIWRIGASVAGALAAAHTKKDDQERLQHVCHGHLGPDHILLSWQGEVRVFGIGLGSALGDVERGERARGALAPEQLRKGLASGAQADVYGVGAVVWSLLGGQPAAPGQGLAKVAEVRDGVADPVASAIDLAVQRAISARRINCQQLEERFDQALSGDGAEELRQTMAGLRAAQPTSGAGDCPAPKPAPALAAAAPPDPPTIPVKSSDPPHPEAPPSVESAPPVHDESVVERISSLFDDIDGAIGDEEAGEPRAEPVLRSEASAEPASEASGDVAQPPADKHDEAGELPAPTVTTPPAVAEGTPSAAAAAATVDAAADATAAAATAAAATAAAATADATVSPRRGVSPVVAAVLALAVGALGFTAAWLLKPAGGMTAPPAGTVPPAPRPPTPPSASTAAAKSSLSAPVPPPSVAPTGQTDGGAVDGTVTEEVPDAAALPPVDEPADAGDGSELLSYEGYLTVRSRVSADVYVQGIHLGTTNRKLKSRCRQRFIRLRDSASGKWLTRGDPVRILCMSSTTVTIDPPGP